MKLAVDVDSPVPLYHQIAEAIRAAIEARELAPGRALEPLRRAAKRWGVNIHTVRHAYAALAREGLVERSRGPRGTRVVDASNRERRSESDLADFLDRIRREANGRFGLGPHALATALVEGTPARDSERPTVYIVECSEWQCLAHAREIADRFLVDALPWPLGRSAEPPAGPVVSTYFHYNDIRRMWPRRLGQVRFLTIYPDPDLRERLPDIRRVIVCERDESTAKAVAADLEALFGDRAIRITTRIADEPEAALRSKQGPPVLFSPRVWATLSEKARSHPRAIEVRYVLDDEELEAMGRAQGWPPAAPAIAVAGRTR